MLMPGDKCYVIENGRYITSVEILFVQGEFYTVKFLNRPQLSVARLRKSRLYSTQLDAQKAIEKQRRLLNRKLIVEKQLELESVTKIYKKSYWPCQIDYEKRHKK